MRRSSFLPLCSMLFLLSVMGCSTPTKNSVSEGYQLSADESRALGKGFVQFFSGDLPNYSYGEEVQLAVDIKVAKEYVVTSLKLHGIVVGVEESGDILKILGRVGSGSGNMNPAGLVIVISSDPEGSMLSIRAVAKEGAIKQDTCGKAVERLISELESSAHVKAVRWKKH